MKRLIKQAIHLIRQNPFYSLITIIGTAVTIAFVMVVVMIYEFRTANIAPESHRSRVMYTDTGVNMKKTVQMCIVEWDVQLMKHCLSIYQE